MAKSQVIRKNFNAPDFVGLLAAKHGKPNVVMLISNVDCSVGVCKNDATKRLLFNLDLFDLCDRHYAEYVEFVNG